MAIESLFLEKRPAYHSYPTAAAFNYWLLLRLHLLLTYWRFSRDFNLSCVLARPHHECSPIKEPIHDVGQGLFVLRVIFHSVVDHLRPIRSLDDKHWRFGALCRKWHLDVCFDSII